MDQLARGEVHTKGQRLSDELRAEHLSEAAQAAAMAGQPIEASPADIHDPRLRREAQKAAIWIGMALLAAMVVFFAQPLLVIFGGIVFAAMIDGGARLLGRALPIGRGWRIAIVLVATALFLVWAAYFTGSQIA